MQKHKTILLPTCVWICQDIIIKQNGSTKFKNIEPKTEFVLVRRPSKALFIVVSVPQETTVGSGYV